MLQEVGNIGRRRGVPDLVGRADLDDASVLHDRDAVAEAYGFVEIVRDEQDRLAHLRLQREQFVLQLAPDHGVQRRERLVHQQDVGVGRQRPRQADALLHAARQLADVAIGPVRESDQRQFLVGDAIAGVGCVAAELEAERDVLAHRPRRDQRELLEDHRDTRQNVGLGLEFRGESLDARNRVADEKLALVGLSDWADRRIGELSGGMQQRVGLARALATDADILLMDEPFSALDAVIRRKLQDELRALQAQVHKTILFVTHDIDEAMRLGDRIAVMQEGRIVQVGTPGTSGTPLRQPMSRTS